MLSPSFDNKTTEYKLDISSNITSLRILAIPENENAKVEITGNDDLKTGSNQINISVTAQNGTTKRNYKIIVYKRNEDEQAKFEKEQEEQKDKLQEAYNTKKTSANTNETNISVQSREERSRNYLIILGIIILSIIVVLGVIYAIKTKFSRQ